MPIDLALLSNIVTGQQIYFQLLRFVVTMVLGVLTTRLVVLPLVKNLLKRRNADIRTNNSIENIIIIISLFTSFTVALQAANFGNLVTVLGTLAAAATVAIGFGMRDQVASIVAGVFIHTDNPFLKNDYIKVGDTEGVVKDIKLRATTLNGPKQEKQIVPNNKLTTEVVKNYTKGTKTKVSLQTKIPLEKLEETTKELQKIAQKTEIVLDKPKPQTQNKNIEDEKTQVELKYWVNKPSYVKESKSEIIQQYSKYFAQIKQEEDDNEKEEKKDDKKQ